jgi:UDP-N-acetylglucosamine 2-epimerase (non-hydrolysing)
MIPVMHTLKERGIEYNLIFMAQHHETIYEIVEQFHLKRPDYILGDTGGDIVTSKAMLFWSIRILFHGLLNKKSIFRNDKNGIVLVHGDAPPLLLGSLIAKAQKLTVASVEAGLRSYNFFKPFPEELIRVISAKSGLIDIFFCQDQKSMNNAEKYRKIAYNTHGNK